MTMRDLSWPNTPEGSREALFRELQAAQAVGAVGFLRTVLIKVAADWIPYVIRIDIACPIDVAIPGPWSYPCVRAVGQRVDCDELLRRLRDAFNGKDLHIDGYQLANHGMAGTWAGRRRFSADPSYGRWPCVEATSRESCPPMPHPEGPFVAPGMPVFPNFAALTRQFTGFEAGGDARGDRTTIVIWDHRARIDPPKWDGARVRLVLEGDAIPAAHVSGSVHLAARKPVPIDAPSATLVEVPVPSAPSSVDLYLLLDDQLLDQLVGAVPRRTPSKEPSMTAKKTSRLTDDVEHLLRSLYRWERAREQADGGQGHLNSADVARLLDWPPERLNRAIGVLEETALVEVDQSLGSAPFDTHGFQLSKRGWLECERVGLDADPASDDDGSMSPDESPDKKKVFIIHGRNVVARKEMGIFLRAIGLEPLNFDDLRASLKGTPTVADVVIAGMKNAQGVVAIFTADEYAALRPSMRGKGESGESVERWQARPNVLFEAGMAFGRDRERVVFVKLGDVDLFSDVGGVHVLTPTNDPKGHRDTLRKVLKGMGCAVNLEPSDWMHDGDFETCVKALPEVSARDPFRP
jgi:predicted nucleotide-binding protein